MSNAGRLAAIFGCEALALSPDELAFFRDCDPFGFILFARNIENPDQVVRLTSQLRDAVGRDAPVLIDQEGGRVQRMRAPHWRDWSPPLDAAHAAGADAARVLGLRARIIAEELRAVGIDANCAPVADIAGPETHPFLRNRCYGETAVHVCERARSVADAHLAAGVLPVVKHLPGHGRATADTHLNLPTVTASPADLAAHDFAPFRALADLPMVAHVAPQATGSYAVVAGNANTQTQVAGTTADYLQVQNWPLALGRGFEPGEEAAGAAVCLLGQTVRDKLFGGSDPVDALIASGMAVIGTPDDAIAISASMCSHM